MTTRRHTDVVRELVDLNRRRVLDVGCGSGGLAAWLVRQNADVLALDLQPAALAKARARGLLVAAAIAEALPVASASRDVVIVFNSLHHFSRPDRALAEARRVLHGGGILLVIEPLAEGGYFTFMQPVDDETGVRAQALAALQAAPDIRLELVQTVDYTHDVVVESLEAAIADWIAVDPQREERIEASRAALAEALAQHGRVSERGHALDQPMRAFVLRPVA